METIRSLVIGCVAFGKTGGKKPMKRHRTQIEREGKARRTLGLLRLPIWQKAFKSPYPIKYLAMAAVLAALCGCAHIRLEYREFDSAGNVSKMATYYSSKDVTGKLVIDPKTGVVTVDLTSTASTVQKASGEATQGVLDAATRAAGTAAAIAAKEAVKP